MPRDLLTGEIETTPLERKPRDLLAGITIPEPITEERKPLKMPTWGEVVMPRYSEIEKRIEERTKSGGAWATLQKELSTPFDISGSAGKTYMRALGKIAVTVAKELDVPRERAFAALSNVIMKLQEPTEKEQDIKVLGELGKEAWKGLSGQRLGQMRDIYARTGVPDPIATVAGLQNEIAIQGVVLDIATKGSLTASSQKANRFLQRRVPRPVVTKNMALQDTKEVSGALDDLYKAFETPYDDIFQKIGNKTVDAQKVTDILDDLPQNLVNKINKSKLITKTTGGEIEPTINNLKHIRGLIRKGVPDKVWAGKAIGTEETAVVEQVYGKIGSIMAEGNPELTALNTKYAEFRQMQKTLSRYVYDADGNIVANKLQRLFSPSGEIAHKNIFLRQFAKQYPRAKDIARDMLAISRRQALRRGLRRTLWWSAIGGGGIYGIKKGLESLGGEGGGGEVGGGY